MSFAAEHLRLFLTAIFKSEHILRATERRHKHKVRAFGKRNFHISNANPSGGES